MVRTIVVGVGNPILGDDGVGILVVQEFKKRAKKLDIVIEEAYTGGLNLLDIIVGYDHAIIVDAIAIPERGVGEVMSLDPRDMNSAHSTNPHSVSFIEALDLSERIREWKVPDRIDLVAVNIRPSLDFSSKLSKEVEGAIPKAVSMVERLLE